MKRIIIIAISACFLSIAAQAQEKEGVKREGAHQSEYNSDAQDERDHTAEIDSRVQPSEEGDNGNADPGNQVQDASSAANTAGVDSRTVSSAGSPGILMSEETPDGTNTMQRASLNIAGSPIPGSGNSSANKTGVDRSPNRVFEGKEQKEIPGTALRNNPPDKAKENK